MNEKSIPRSALHLPPLPDETAVREALARARALVDRKILVLDDDPTGIQTVYDVPVYTDWSQKTLCRALCEAGSLAFILTNSRGLTAPETAAVHTEIARHLAAAAEETGRRFLLVSRSDSTLRGHYPLETSVLRRELEARLGCRYDGEILMPYFREGGRLTVGNVHYVETGELLVPAGQTEFARDTTFAYTSSDLTEWCAERTGGAYPAESVVTVSLEELRAPDYDGITRKLLSVHDFGKVVVNAADDRDVEVFAAALFRAVAGGREFMFRCAAGLVRVLGGVERRSLLTRSQICPDCPGRGGVGGLVIVGSHVEKTTRQLQCLLENVPETEGICFDASGALRPGGLAAEENRVTLAAEAAVRAGRTAVVYTSRKVLRVDSGSSEENLDLSVRISGAVTAVAAHIGVRPTFLVAKGGITSSDVGIKALGVRRAWVLGQIAPGVPVWRTGEESRFPGLGYVIFPGNVGDVQTLKDVVSVLLGH